MGELSLSKFCLCVPYIMQKSYEMYIANKECITGLNPLASFFMHINFFRYVVQPVK